MENSAAAEDMVIYFPLDPVERAKQDRVENLLPVELYGRLCERIDMALPESADAGESPSDYFNRTRGHNAVLVEGSRGVGKSTVLVNLPLFLKERQPELFRRVHVLKPVDPTQLEEHEDLFLNVIVAAVMSDDAVQAAIQTDGSAREALHKSLHALSVALEARQTGRTTAGIDQLRAFMGSHLMTQTIHDFFQAAANAIGKDLLVLCLDDVDTTLDRAFENLEVVRRYLSTPVVLPVICGDFALYHEVIRRQFHRRIVGDGAHALPVSHDKAADLATEYERKLLPVRSRLSLPSIDEYFADARIRFIGPRPDRGAYSIGLIEFRDWVEAMLMGPVNGLENSTLPVPIPSIRAMAQLAGRMNSAINRLDRLLAASPTSDRLDIRTRLQMPGTSRDDILALQRELDASRVADKTDTQAAYRVFNERRGLVEQFPPDADLNHEARAWRRPLYEFLRYEPEAGRACMVLEAALHWDGAGQSWGGVHPRAGVLDTPLFMPMLQQDPRYLEFAPRAAHLSDWKDALKDRLPDDAFRHLPQASIAPFPVPELGRPIPAKSQARFELSTLPSVQRDEKVPPVGRLARLNAINELMLHRGYYTATERAPLLLTGRLLELLVTGLVRDVSDSDIHRMQSAAPFHSAGAIAPTKTLIVGGDDVGAAFGADDEAAGGEEDGVSLLVRDINQWREELGLGGFQPSPWLIYNALNKTLGQARIFNLATVAPLPAVPALFIAQTARMTFDAFTAAVGSFEKGPLFGMAPVVSTINVTRSEHFTQSGLYLQNIAPFWAGQRNSFGRAVRSVTNALSAHPFRTLLRGLSSGTGRPSPPTRGSAPSPKSKGREDEAKRWLRHRLGGGGSSAVLGAKMVANLIRRSGLSVQDVRGIERELERGFPEVQRARRVLAQGATLAFAH